MLCQLVHALNWYNKYPLTTAQTNSMATDTGITARNKQRLTHLPVLVLKVLHELPMFGILHYQSGLPYPHVLVCFSASTPLDCYFPRGTKGQLTEGPLLSSLLKARVSPGYSTLIILLSSGNDFSCTYG